MQMLLINRLPHKRGSRNGATPAAGTAEVDMLAAIETLDKLTDTLRSAAFELAEARLHVPRDRRTRSLRPRKPFREAIEHVARAEGELASVWLTLRKADFSPLIDAATRP